MHQDQWRICLFGRLQIQKEQQTLTHFSMRRIGALLACLVMRAPNPVPREELLALLWPDEASEIARNRLRVLLSSLRRNLEPSDAAPASVLATERNGMRLVSSAFTSDYHDFLDAVRAARTADETEAILLLEKAIALYQNELLVGFYDEWILAERSRMAEMRYQALRDLVHRLLQCGRPERAIEYARQAVAAEPMDEEAHCDLMRLYDSLGQPSAGLRQYEQLKRLLQEELQAQPSEPTRRLAAQIEANLGHGMAQSRRSVRAVTLRASEQEANVHKFPETLPLRLTRFFGREQEIASLRRVLLPDSAARLVTLLGLGGIGKTRLAIETAAQLKADYAGRIVYVSLAEICDPRLIFGAITDALRLRRSAQVSPLDQVIPVLSTQPSLLILDNVEHLIGEDLPIIGLGEVDARTIVQTLLHQVSDLTCLLTSRRPLEIDGEIQFLVPPLPIPAILPVSKPAREAEHAGLLSSSDSPSLQMFVDRAQAVRPDFQLTSRNLNALMTLSVRLEGLPLAIELAAAWAQTFTPAQMLSSLASGRLLVSRHKDRPERHSSLRAAISWSFHLLAPLLQRFFARLSVFVGGWSLEAAAEICEEEGAAQALSELRARSMIQAEEAGNVMRYRLLETLREFAWEQLPTSEQERLQRAHALYWMQAGEEISGKWNGPELEDCLNRLEQERANVTAVLNWCAEPPHADLSPSPVEMGVRIVGALWKFWNMRGDVREARQLAARLLERAGPEISPRALARAHTTAGILARTASDYADALAHCKQALAYWRQAGHSDGIAAALGNIGSLLSDQGQPEEAGTFHAEGLALARETGIPWRIADFLNNLGSVQRALGDFDAAEAHLQEALALRKQIGDRRAIWSTLSNLSALMLDRDEFAAALAGHREALMIAQELDDRLAIAASQVYLGSVHLALKDAPAARRCLEEGLRLNTAGGSRMGQAYALEGLAAHAAARNASERAGLLLGASRTLMQAIHVASTLLNRRQADAAFGHLAADPRFLSAQEIGRRMPLEETIAYALKTTEE